MKVKVDPSSDVEGRLATGDLKQTKEKRVALVTGAASGLGRAIALALKKDGFFVFGTSRHSAEPSVPLDFPLLQLDVRSDDSVRSALEHVRLLAGHLDVLVNNAGFRFLGAAEETSVDEAKAVFDTNFFGAHRVTAAALPLLRATHASKIINITSLSGLNALPFGSIYSASKWGARSLLRVAPPRGQVARDLCFDRRARRDPLRKAGTAAPAQGDGPSV